MSLYVKYAGAAVGGIQGELIDARGDAVVDIQQRVDAGAGTGIAANHSHRDAVISGIPGQEVRVDGRSQSDQAFGAGSH